MPPGTIVGIDLGTSNTCVALCLGAKPEVVANQQGERTTPSVVAFTEDGKILVGSPAWRQAVMNPRRTITGVKRLVGHRYSSSAIKDLERGLPYSLCASDIGDAWVQIDKQKISPQEIQAYVLERVRDDAQKYVNGKVTGAVITVPAFFDEIQRQAVRDAAEIAGFDHARVLSEPTAAALAYGYAQLDQRKIVVADFGGGTLDITIMSVDRGRFEVLATDGDLLLGGADFDRILVDSFANEIKQAHGVDVLTDAIAFQRLISEAELAKRTLSQEASVVVSLPHLADGRNGPIHYEKTLTRQEFDEISRSLVDRITEPCHKALKQANLQIRHIDEVILVGGMTRTPAIQKQIGDIFQRKPALRVNPDEVVAMGASLLAAATANRRNDITFVDVTPRAIGLRVAGNQMSTLIPKSTPLPTKVTKAFATTQDNQDYFELEVLQGEESSAAKNRQLAVVRIEPIPKKRAGDIKLKVTFEIDLEGRLGVNALEMSSQQETVATVRPLSGLTRNEVQELRTKHGHADQAAAPVQEQPVPVQAGFSIQFGSRDPVAEGTPRPQLTRKVAAPVAPRKTPPRASPAMAPPPASPPAHQPMAAHATTSTGKMATRSPAPAVRTAPAAPSSFAAATASAHAAAATVPPSKFRLIMFATFLTLIVAAVITSVLYLG